MDRRAFLTYLGVGGAAVGGAVAGSAVRAGADERWSRSSREVGAYAGHGRGRLDVLWSVTTDEKVAALTFDDGPNATFTPRVLDILAAADVVATFFVLGRLVAENPVLLRRVRDSGHEIANHSWSHVSAATAVDEIDRATDAIRRATGAPPRWYRPPRGMVTGAALRQAHQHGQGVALWSVDRGPAADTDRDGVRRWLIDEIHAGAVIDLHDGVGASSFAGPAGYAPDLVRRRNTELAVLPDVLVAWTAAGYRLVTLSEMAGPAPTA